MIFRFVRPDKVDAWLRNNYPASINGTPGDNWKKFLATHGGTGDTFYDLETSYLNNNRLTIVDRWGLFVANAGYTTGIFLDRVRAYFDGIISTGGVPGSGMPISAGNYMFITYP